MTFDGIIIGAGTFLLIGLLHPVVVKTEYYFGRRAWPVFLALGLAGIGGSAVAGNVVVSALLAVLGFSLLWSIRELFEQEERVKKGWHPANPKRRAPDTGAPALNTSMDSIAGPIAEKKLFPHKKSE